MNDPSNFAPPEANWTTKDDLRRCWNCDFYSFKVYGGEDSTQGKCFRDRDKSRKVWWVDGLMTCPSWKPDRTVTDEQLVQTGDPDAAPDASDH
jgi:hypothetical protein